MEKYKYAIACLMVSMSFSGSLSANHSPVIHKLKNLPSQWYKLSFMPFFYDKTKLNGDSIIMWNIKGSDSTKDLDNTLKKISKKLKNHIFSQQSVNPFRAVYPDTYTQQAQLAFKKCDFVGIQFELDDRSDTQEWYIAAPVETCLHGDNAIGQIPAGSYSNTHYWVLQKDKHSDYKILMESEGLLTVTNIKHQGYKQLKTEMFNQHVYRKKALKEHYPLLSCGGAGIKWQFKKGKYYPIVLSENPVFCDRGYDEMMHPYERSILLDKQLKKVVRPQVLQWLNRLSKEPLTVEWKSGICQLWSNKQKGQSRI